VYRLTGRGRVLRGYLAPLDRSSQFTQFPVLVPLRTAARELGLSLNSLWNKRYSFLHYLTLPCRRTYVVKKIDHNSDLYRKVPTLPIVRTYSQLLYLFPNPPGYMNDLLNNLKRNGSWDWNEVLWHVRRHATEKYPRLEGKDGQRHRDEEGGGNRASPV
jgi:hypothetical protein